MAFKFNPFTGNLDKVINTTIQFMQDATNNDFRQWTLTDLTLNGSNQLRISDI